MKLRLTVIILLFIFQANAQCFEFINTGNYQTLALKSDHTLWGWGANYNGELGDGTYLVRNTISQIGTASNWQSISTGAEHTLAIKTDGTLWAWGSNSAGQLGDGTTIKKNVPIQIGTANNWQTVSTKGWTSFAIKNDGTLWGWGQNNIGNIGLGYQSLQVLIPMQVGIESNWKNIYAGSNHTVAIKTNNTLWSWGNNLEGQIGIGVFTGWYHSPMQVGSDADWKTVSTGYHTLALKLNGTLWSWGANINGELGNGTTTHQNQPLQVGLANDWDKIAASINSSFGIKTDGTAWAWGDNSYYQLGNGSTTDSNIPIQIGNEANWKSISGRDAHEIALKTDNSVFYWGNNLNAIPTVSTIPSQLTSNCSLSIDSNNFDENFLFIYPNPSNQKIHVLNTSDQAIISMTFSDMTGKKVLDLRNDLSEINIEKLANGIYLVTITLENDFFKTVKFIKE